MAQFKRVQIPKAEWDQWIYDSIKDLEDAVKALKAQVESLRALVGKK